MNALLGLPTSTLQKLAGAIKRKAVKAPFSTANLAALVPNATVPQVAQALQQMLEAGSTETGVAMTLEMLAASRAQSPSFGSVASFVSSGPAPALQGRDTAVVVPELFREARRDVLVVGYTAKKGADIFEPLHQQRERFPGLRIRLCLNIARAWGDKRPADEILSAFRKELATEIWKWPPLPELFYDPRALLPFDGPRGSLHGKAIVVDEASALVTSANFTEAAQERNIELGVLVRDPGFAQTVQGHIDKLIDRELLMRLELRG